MPSKLEREWGFGDPRPPFVSYSFRAFLIGLALLMGLMIAVAYGSYQEGHADGFDEGLAESTHTATLAAILPSCQEDEYLYPSTYAGPGKNKPSDYICVHYDDIVTGIVKATLLELGLVETERVP